MKIDQAENPRLISCQGYTLIDITNTGVTKYTLDSYHQRNQQRNWETLQQILGMRTQLFEVKQTLLSKQNLNVYDFGSAYAGKHNVWMFEFTVEFVNAVPIKDFDQVPVITGLDETVDVPTSLFVTSGEYKNIYFKTLV